MERLDSHTIINERLHQYEFGVSFFAQSQDDQDRAAVFILMGIL
jgi:hypothetical protein